MGKTEKVKKHKQSRDNPTGLTIENENLELAEDVGAMALKPNLVLSADTVKSLSKQLQSSSAEDRDCACQALSGLIKNSDDSHTALHEGLVKVLGPLLLDVNHSVCHSAASALHSLIQIGGDPAIKLAIDHDVLTPLLTLLQRIPSTWKPRSESGEKIDTATATFIEAVSSLSILSESSSVAVDRIHREKVISILIKFIDSKSYSVEVASAVAQLLSTVTEDQGDSDYAPVLKHEVTSKIMADDQSSLLLRALGAMILLNLNGQSFNADLGISAETMVNILSTSLNQDHRKAASSVVDYLPIKNPVDDEEQSMDMEEISTDVKLQDSIAAAENLLSVLIKSLEILTNLCCPSDDCDSEDFYQSDDGCSGDAESMDAEGLEDTQFDLNPELKEAFLKAKLFQAVLERAKIPAENVVEALMQHPSGKLLLKRYETLQSRAFLCLSNIVTAFNVEEVGGGKELFDVWCNLAVLAFQEGQKSDQVLEAATTSMRAIIRKLSLHNDDMVVALLKVDDISVLCQKVEVCSQTQSKVNLLQILGTLGSMAAGTEPLPVLDATRAAVVRGIGQVLLDTACQATDLLIAAEALDAIFDVFKEDHVDFIAVEILLVERLKQLAPSFKQRVHAQRRRPSDQFPVVMTVKDNLMRFIKYKVKQRAMSSR